MTSVCDLPPEILLHVIQHLDQVKDVSALSRSGSRFIRDIATPILYSRVKDVPDVLCWACDEGQIGTVRRLLHAGTDPNATWTHTQKRSATLTDISNLWSGDMSVWNWTSMHRKAENDAMLAEGHQAREDDVDELYAPDSGDDEYDEDSDSDIDSASEFDSDSASASDSESGSEPSSPEYDSDGHEAIADKYFWTPLHIAARWGLDDIINLLLDHGATVNPSSRGFCDCAFATSSTTKGPRGVEQLLPLWTPLHNAICYGHESTTRLLLSRGASVIVTRGLDKGKRSKVTALHVACAAGVVSIVRFLIENHQPDFEVTDHHGQTPLSWAYFTGMWQVIDFLVENGATLNARLGTWPLLKHACMELRFAEALRLIELGVDIYAGPDQKYSQTGPVWPLRCCCIRKNWHKEIKHMDLYVALRAKRQKHLRERAVEVLLEADLKIAADLNAVDRKIEMGFKDHWIAPLVDAALNHLPTVVALLLETLQEHDSAHTKAELLPVLLFALRSHVKSPKNAMLETVKVILAFMPEDLTNGDIIKAVITMCGNGNKQKDKEAVVRLLSEQRDDFTLNRRAFHKRIWNEAIGNGNINLCKLLLGKGLKPPSREEFDLLVSMAIEADSVAALEYLLTLEGASEIMLTGPRLHKAISDQKARCAVFLSDRGAPVNYRSPTGETCLLQASMLQNNTPARKLLEKGADPNVRGANITDTPLVVATIKKDEQLVDELLRHGANVHGQEGHASALATAMFIGFLDGVRSMVYSSSFAEAAEDKRNSYISIALSLPDDAWDLAATFDYILRGRGVDPNCVFREMGGIAPLHLAVIRPRPLAFNLLLKHGADMHRRPGLGSDDDEDVASLSKTTPLEFAIHHADPSTVRDMLSQLPLSPEAAESSEDCPFSWMADELREVLTPQLLADYVRAACYRMKRPMFAVLIDFKLDFRLRDPRNGDTALHMVCDAMKEYMKEPDWDAGKVGVRAAASVLMLLEEGIDVDPKIENNAGVSGLQLVRQTMEYSGDDQFWKEVAEVWGMMLIVDDDGIRERPEGPEFAQAKFGAAPD